MTYLFLEQKRTPQERSRKEFLEGNVRSVYEKPYPPHTVPVKC